ncbi:MAG: PBSX family phage terminase large subunit, partial [Oscillospiraceae bacterium]|nr:PBSX family phage terminase large subunit [Oscillospiraceae bacterium]
MIKRYCSLYSGAFYERFVLGKWVSASGLVYPMFSYDKHTFTSPPPSFSEYYISCDYGTMNPTSMGLWGYYGGVWYRIAEYYHDARRENIIKTDEEYYLELESLAGNRKITAVIVDPSAASFIECIKRHEKFTVTKAKNDVINGIRKVSDALKNGDIKISTSCADTLREFSLYRWDENSACDCVKKEFDHAMDDIRYFVATAMAKPETDNFFFVSLNRK